MPQRVAVVGAGMSGMSTALALQAEGHTVRVFLQKALVPVGSLRSVFPLSPMQRRLRQREGFTFRGFRSTDVPMGVRVVHGLQVTLFDSQKPGEGASEGNNGLFADYAVRFEFSLCC
eukprot:5706740-Pyramimonas_sp.AAC.1